MLIGILGAGQLGRMLALSGYPLGMRFRFLDPSPDSSAGQVGPHTVAAFTDHAALREFASDVDAITWEFENVPVSTVEFLSTIARVHPPVAAIATGQDRLSEKQLFESLGLHVHPYAPAHTREELLEAVARIGTPCVAKTRRLGYDGKGQAVIRVPGDALTAWDSIARQPCIIEQFVEFDSEASVIAVRSAAGDIRAYPLTQNVHQGGILRSSSVPAVGLSPHLALAAEAHIRAVMNHLNYVGVLAIEFFVAGDRLLANEMAPRVHNSGHWTIEGAVTSQFENHLRAVAGLPLGDTSLRGQGSVMINIIGREVQTAALTGIPGAHVHNYGKAPRPGRKVGHVTLNPVPENWRELPAIKDILPQE